MYVGFTNDFEALGVYVDLFRQYESIVSGDVNEFFEIGMLGIPLFDIYEDDISGHNVSVHRLEGISVCSALTFPVSYNRTFVTIVEGQQAKAEDTLTELNCGERSYLEVRVFLPGGE